VTPVHLEANISETAGDSDFATAYMPKWRIVTAYVSGAQQSTVQKWFVCRKTDESFGRWFLYYFCI